MAVTKFGKGSAKGVSKGVSNGKGKLTSVPEQASFEHPPVELIDLESQRSEQTTEQQRERGDGPQIDLEGCEHCGEPPILVGTACERILMLLIWLSVQLLKKLEWLGGKVVSIELRLCLMQMDENTCV